MVYDEYVESDDPDSEDETVVHYVKPILKEKPISEITEDMFGIDPDEPYVGSYDTEPTKVDENSQKDNKAKAKGTKTKKVIDAVALETTQLLYGQDGAGGFNTGGVGVGVFYWPLDPDANVTVTSMFGEKRSYENHPGYDLACKTGTKIFAAADGKLEIAGVYGGYGNCVIIRHSKNLQTVYGHMSVINVKVGQTVQKGQRIGIMGETGAATGVHVHIEVFLNGNRTDPLKYMYPHLQ
jgi:murein DD-endopeptidase MepM/ murein hydrolase activator NlpD